MNLIAAYHLHGWRLRNATNRSKGDTKNFYMTEATLREALGHSTIGAGSPAMGCKPCSVKHAPQQSTPSDTKHFVVAILLAFCSFLGLVHWRWKHSLLIVDGFAAVFPVHEQCISGQQPLQMTPMGCRLDIQANLRIDPSCKPSDLIC